jgi:CRISPR/Cas system-associated endonuclease/helicase Cas3
MNAVIIFTATLPDYSSIPIFKRVDANKSVVKIYDDVHNV